jgi:HAD superfamily hydrolase (TIGR01549 family)
MGIAAGHSILEAVAQLDGLQAANCHAILERHEREGVERATLMPGVDELLARVAGHQWRQAILTRNSREMSLATLEKFGIHFDPLMARDDAPPKPDPTAIWRICESWSISPAEVAVIGDYRFDLEAARRAGARSVLYSAGRKLSGIEYRHLADFVVESFDDCDSLFCWLLEST